MIGYEARDMPLEFTKMHGIGNDFIVINALERPFSLPIDEISRLSHRRFGIGFDQILVIEPATSEEAEFNYRIFNADGSEVENCGNGARCFARYVIDKGLTSSREIPVSTSAGMMHLIDNEDGQVTVRMEVPKFAPKEIPFLADSEEDTYQLQVDGGLLDVGAVALGNPHVVTIVNAVRTAQVEKLGPLMESHERFPQRVNAGFMEIVSRQEIRLRVYERGVGETMACGTGACAAVVVGNRQDVLDPDVLVHLEGGDLQVSWPGKNAPIMMTGPCETVFEGRLE